MLMADCRYKTYVPRRGIDRESNKKYLSSVLSHIFILSSLKSTFELHLCINILQITLYLLQICAVITHEGIHTI